MMVLEAVEIAEGSTLLVVAEEARKCLGIGFSIPKNMKLGFGLGKTKRRLIFFLSHLSFSLLSLSLSLLCSAMEFEGLPLGYRPNIGICLINDDNQIFVASRLNVPGAWQMPQGSIEDREDPKSAAIRELREETGVVSVEIIAEVPKWLTYEFPPAVKAKVNRLWGGEWHGQAQKWFIMRFKADDSEINLANGEAEMEFSEWKWATPEEVIDQAVDYKRPVYEEVMSAFKPYIDSSAKSAKCKSAKW